MGNMRRKKEPVTVRYWSEVLKLGTPGKSMDEAVGDFAVSKGSTVAVALLETSRGQDLS